MRAAEERKCLERVLGAEVDVAPRGVECTDFEHDQVEGAEPILDVGVFGRETGVAAEENGASLAPQDERRPERQVASSERATRKVLRRRRRDRKTAARQLGAFPPVELRDARRRNAPRL